ncbi:hypothetical protein [Methylocapsa acidiphila]|uniref:hypothetical protein n=1 Tax=Methylocapsa acidiphila TaxID=133552 RepID=UPI000421510D|nr:hypothetical protein [Methylocapsa acidiphila]
MKQGSHQRLNIELPIGAALWLLVALVLAWCLVGLNLGVPFLKAIFAGKQVRLVQAHIDFLLMTALILGIYATRTPLHWTLRWSMVLGAFTNSSLFLLMAIFPVLDSPTAADNGLVALYKIYTLASVSMTSYGFAGAAITILWRIFQGAAMGPFAKE